MCGIIGHIEKRKGISGEKVASQYEDQHTRGTQGFGLVEISKKSVRVQRATEPVKALIDIRMSKAPVMIFHHRMPTSTENKMSQTHPIKVSHAELEHDYLVVHNGVIRNDDELFKIHTEELGYAYSTLEGGKVTTYKYSDYQYKEPIHFNDSEAFAIELVRFIEGKSKEIGSIGSAAFIALQLNKKTGLAKGMMWGRNSGNPVELLETESGLLIASNINNVEAEIITPDTFDFLDLEAFFKESPEEIRSLITNQKLAFKEEPIPDVPSRAVGFHMPTQKLTSSTVTKETNIPTTVEDTMTPREVAFLRMAERITEDVGVMIEDICSDMAYNEVSEDAITDVATELMEILMNKNKLAKEKIRPHYDRREEEDFNDEMMQWETSSEAIDELEAQHRHLDAII